MSEALMKRIIQSLLVIFLGVGTANAAWYTGRINRMQVTPSSGARMVYVQASTQHECGSYQINFFLVTPHSRASNTSSRRSCHTRRRGMTFSFSSTVVLEASESFRTSKARLVFEHLRSAISNLPEKKR
jgi:hypothetical protein